MDWHVPPAKEWEVLLKKCNYSSKGALFANSPEWIMDNEKDEFTDEYVYFWTQSEVLNQGEREKTHQAYMVFGDNYGQLFFLKSQYFAFTNA